MEVRLPKTPSARAEAEMGLWGVPEGVPLGVFPPKGVEKPPATPIGVLKARALDAAAPVIRLDFGGESPSAPSNSWAAPPRRFSPLQGARRGVCFCCCCCASPEGMSIDLEDKSSPDIPRRDGVEREFFIPECTRGEIEFQIKNYYKQQNSSY